MKKLWIILFSLLFSSALFAQVDGLSTKSKKAAKNYNDALMAFNTGHFDDAEAYLLNAIKEDTNFVDAYSLLANTYIALDKNILAIKELRKQLSINPNLYPIGYFTLGRLDIGEGNYDEALYCLQKFQKYNIQDNDIKTLTEFYIADCNYAPTAMKNPVPFNPKNMGPAINTVNGEYFPAMTCDGQTFIFTRQLPDPYLQEGLQEDMYISYKVNGEWTQAVSVGYPLNTEHTNEGAPTLSADGHLLIYASDAPGGYGSVDLYYSFKVGNSWTMGRNLGRPINSANWESQPCLSTDGKTLYFVRGDKHETPSSIDIYVTTLSDTGTWSNPQRLSDSINTAGMDSYPFIAADNQTLYFCSDGHPGFGGMDIFMSRKLPNGRWGPAKNLGYPINSSKDENSIMVDPQGQLAYFSSDRAGGYGGLDIYYFPLYDSIKPTPVTYMKGKVYDAKTNDPLIAKFVLTDLKTGQVAVRSTSAPGDGTFLVCLPISKDYALSVSRKGYLFYSDNFSLEGVSGTATQPYLMDIPLQPIDTGATIVLKNVFYETDKFDLKPESKIELNKVVSFLNENPTVKIEVSGHTDNTGGIEHNNTLSKNRAKSVYDYLVSQGISADRLTYKGYGSSRPIADNSTPEGRAKNRRTEMKITGK